MTGKTAYRAPHPALFWSEQARAALDAATFLAALPGLAGGERGDGHHVLVLPGLLADDRSTAALRNVLRARGYRAHGWGLGSNVGPTRRVRDGLVARLDDLSGRGQGPVTLIGWSLGGILARRLAVMAPDQVRAVITLGSPFRLTLGDGPGASHAGAIFEALRPWHTDMLDIGAVPEEERPALTMRSTSIYSQLDGVVPWRACIDDGPLGENLEVSSSHIGMGVNAQVIGLVLDRLARPAGPHDRLGASTAA